MTNMKNEKWETPKPPSHYKKTKWDLDDEHEQIWNEMKMPPIHHDDEHWCEFYLWKTKNETGVYPRSDCWNNINSASRTIIAAPALRDTGLETKTAPTQHKRNQPYHVEELHLMSSWNETKGTKTNNESPRTSTIHHDEQFEFDEKFQSYER